MTAEKKKKHPGGRPPKYTSPEKMQEVIDEYFLKCQGEMLTDDEGRPMLDKYSMPIVIKARPPTVTGLALALGFTGRQALLDYQAREEFADIVTRAKSRVEQYCEERLFDKDGQKGAAFALSHNFGWVTKTPEAQTEDKGQGVVLMPEVKAGGK